jgi:polygalacturonase
MSAPHGVLPEASENTPDTMRIQSAIDQCPRGKAVELKPASDKNIFLTGPLQLRPGVTLLIDANAALFASRNPRDYDITPGSCGVIADGGQGCKPIILAEAAPGSGIMGDGAIDGRGGANLLGQDATWWDLAHTAKVEGRSQRVPRMLVVRRSDNFTLYRITLRNSPNFHAGVERTNGFTAWGVRIQTPKTARNTDGIDPSSSTNVTITHCYIATGDDNVAIKSGDAGPASHITIAHNHFYSGHGMSIGSGTSGGVNAVRVTDLSIDGADNGIRIKSDRSRGGLVQDVSYENVCMRNVVNPVVLTTMYTTFPGDKLPVYRDILLKDIRSVTNGAFTLLGLDAEHRLGVTFDNVSVDVQPDDVRAEHVDIRVGPRRGNFVPKGSDVSVRDAGASPSAPLNCEGRFPGFPESPTAPAAAVKVPPEDKTLYVAANGTGDYYSIQRAIEVAPPQGALISITTGTYREVLRITKPNIVLRGSHPDPSKTVIVFNNSAGTTGSTFRSATVEVTADDFRAENLTFANDYNATHPQQPQGSQALALLVTGDRAVFRNMRFLGNQDTLYAGTKGCTPPGDAPCTPARQYFSNCYIEGNVDFIFGSGKAVFEQCEIHSTPHSIGFVTAQGKHYPEQDSAFVFNRCRLTAEPGVTNVWLGRPWRPYASVVFLNTEMGAHVQPAGWREWHPGETRSIETAFYAEYNSSGPGAHRGQRDPHTKQLSADEAARFETKRFLAGSDGWDPTAVPAKGFKLY